MLRSYCKSACSRLQYVTRYFHQNSSSVQEDITKHQNALKKCIDNEINPYVDQWEREGNFPAHEVFKKFGNLGLFGIGYSVEYGGMDLDYRYVMGAAEALGHIHCGGIPMALSVQMEMSTPALANFGSDELKKEFLTPSIAGDCVSCIAVSEPGGGSDVASLKTTAKREGDDYIINGQKMWITNAFHADWACLLANTSDGPVHSNKSLICVPMKTPGVHLAKRIDKLGMRSSDTGQIYFDNVRVPVKYRIGEEGKGFLYQMMQFQRERLIVIGITLPAFELCVQETIKYTKERKIFNQPILNNQVVHFRLAELMTEVECLRALLEKATDKIIQNEDVTMLASMGKLKSGRLARELTDSCLQYWGGMGFTNEVLISRFYRDLRVGSIGGGADEVMLGIICKLAGILPNPKKK